MTNGVPNVHRVTFYRDGAYCIIDAESLTAKRDDIVKFYNLTGYPVVLLFPQDKPFGKTKVTIPPLEAAQETVLAVQVGPYPYSAYWMETTGNSLVYAKAAAPTTAVPIIIIYEPKL